jgi:tetratricopeptide (TPR) repeat protein
MPRLFLALLAAVLSPSVEPLMAAGTTPLTVEYPPGAASASPQSAAIGYTYVHHPVSTDLQAAQFAFDRGLTMFFAYQPDEAEQAFRQAAKLDPELAMAWWGIGLSVGPNINEEPSPAKTVTAADALSRATTLAAKRATAIERDYINALSARYTTAPNPDFDQLANRYRDAMRELVQKYPDDADGRALFAEAIMDLHPWRLWNSDGTPAAGTQELVDNIERGLAAQPNHLGLLHFYIHAVEASNDATRAAPMAHRLAALPMEPAAAHLIHMPAHIYMRIGDWEAAIAANEHATHNALNYRLSTDPKAQRACSHCADFLSYAYMMQADQAHARKSADDYQTMSDDPTNSIAVLARFGQWDDVLSFPEPAADLKTFAHNAHAIRGFWHFARGLAFVGSHRLDQAQSELVALRSEAVLAPAAASFDGPPDVQNVLDKITQTCDAFNLKIGAALLGSRIAETKRQMPQAIELMRTAVKLQDDMPYSEPPPWFYPIRESLGALLLRGGSTAESVAVFRESLGRTPNDPRALLGLSAALAAQGHKAEAAMERAHFEAAAKYSDVKLAISDL